MPQQNQCLFYLPLFIALFTANIIYATHTVSTHLVVYMPIVHVFVHEQHVQPRVATTQQSVEGECVIDIARLRYTANEQRYPLEQAPVSRIERVHCFIARVKKGCFPWWCKEKVD